MELDILEKSKLKVIIETEAYGIYDDQMKAKDELDRLAKDIKAKFLVEPSIFKKLVKLHYEKSIEIERAKFSMVDDLYVEIFGEPKPAPSLFDPREELDETGLDDRAKEEVKSLKKKYTGGMIEEPLLPEDNDPINDTIDKDEVLDKIKYGLK